jgi:pimeloyl-ACP methyl ester carboxylesterase
VARTEDRLVTVTASDGVEHDALLHRNGVAAERRTAATGRRTALVHLHGNQGSFTVGSLRFAHAPLASLGFPLLALETRVGNVSQIFGEALFEETAEDVEGAVALLAREGFDGVVVSGYSLGAVMAIRAAAGKLPLPVRGLLTFGASADLPESTRRLMDANDARPGYEEMVALTRPAAGRPQDDFPVVVRRAYLPSDAPRGAGVYTARTWWHSRGPAAIDSRSHRWIGRVDAPILLVQGTEDAIVAPEDADRLADIARAAGREAEIARIEGAGHSFHGYAPSHRGRRRVARAHRLAEPPTTPRSPVRHRARRAHDSEQPQRGLRSSPRSKSARLRATAHTVERRDMDVPRILRREGALGATNRAALATKCEG